MIFCEKGILRITKYIPTWLRIYNVNKDRFVRTLITRINYLIEIHTVFHSELLRIHDCPYSGTLILLDDWIRHDYLVKTNLVMPIW